MTFATPMGMLTVTETLLYFDGPQILSCEDPAGHRYVAHLVEESEGMARWFLVPVSPERLAAIRTGDIDLRTSVSSPEPGWIWDLAVHHDGRPGDAVKRDAGSLSDRELPGPDARLHLRGR